MPAGKSLYDLIKSIIEEEERRIKETVEKIEEEIEKEFADFETPLYTVNESSNEYDYLVDIPYLDPDSVHIKRTQNLMIVTFKNKRGKNYLLKIRIPVDADPNSATFYIVRGYVRIVLKRK